MEALGLCDAELLELGEREADGDCDNEAEDDGLKLADGESDALALDEGDTEALGLRLGLSLEEGDNEADGDKEEPPPACPGSAWRVLELSRKNDILFYLALPGLKGLGLRAFVDVLLNKSCENSTHGLYRLVSPEARGQSVALLLPV